jgi:AcrR family transcriptional regulator
MESTKEKIINSARNVFIQKGFAGARMREIADRAGMNKGLLHYYFKSKENLHHAVVNEVVEGIIPHIGAILAGEAGFETKLRKFIGFYIDFLIKNPWMPSFIINEMNMRGEEFAREIMIRNRIEPKTLLAQIETESMNCNMRVVNPVQLLINISSLVVFPFIARPTLQAVMGINEEKFGKLMEKRKEEVAEFIINAMSKSDHQNG